MKKLYPLVLMLSMAGLSASAAWDGSSTEAWTKGDGSEANPYLIENEQQFANFQQSVSAGESYASKFFRLTANLDFSGKTMYPVGFYGKYSESDVNYDESKIFLGTFDGNYKTVDNLNIIPDPDKSEFSEVGGMGLFAAGQKGTVVRNLIVGSKTTVNAPEWSFTAGIMGMGEGVVIENCEFAGSVTGGSMNTAGIIGDASADSRIRGCIFSGNVKGNSFTGGIAGDIYNSSCDNCLSSGTTNGNQGYYIAGVVGWAYSSTVSNCLALGKVLGPIGTSYSPGISPICADLDRSTATNCYYVKELTGCDPLRTQAGVTAKSEAEVKATEMVSTLNGSTAEGAWTTGADGTPTLAWTKNAMSGIATNIAANGARAYSDGANIIVEAEDADVAVFDITGRNIATARVAGSATFTPAAKGVYIVVVSGSNGSKSVFKLAF